MSLLKGVCVCGRAAVGVCVRRVKCHKGLLVARATTSKEKPGKPGKAGGNVEQKKCENMPAG